MKNNKKGYSKYADCETKIREWAFWGTENEKDAAAFERKEIHLVKHRSFFIFRGLL